MFKIKKIPKKVSRYLMLRKELGGFFIEEKEEVNILYNYGLTYVRKVGFKGSRSIILIKDGTILANFKEADQISYWLSPDKSHIIISIGENVFKKYKNEDKLNKIEELKNTKPLYEFYDSPFRKDLAVIFKPEIDSQDLILKILNLQTGKIMNITCVEIQEMHKALKCGIKIKLSKEPFPTYMYMYIHKDEVLISKIFAKEFSDMPGYQINSELGKKAKIYKVSPEDGIKAVTSEWDELRVIKSMPLSYLGIINKKFGQGKAYLLNMYKPKLEICELPGSEIKFIRKIGKENYYQILNKDTKKVYLVTLKEGVPQIHIEYEGKSIKFSRPILDLKKGEIKRKILVEKYLPN